MEKMLGAYGNSESGSEKKFLKKAKQLAKGRY